MTNVSYYDKINVDKIIHISHKKGGNSSEKKDALYIPKKFIMSLSKTHLTPTEYRCIMLLLNYGEYMPSKVSNELHLARQPVSKAFIHLEKLGIIEKVRVEGRNTFFKVNLNYFVNDTEVPNQLIS